MTHVTDFAYCIEEFEVPSYPGIIIMLGWLNISIERVNGDLSYTIDSIELEKADFKSCHSFVKGSFIYDIVVPHIYENEKISASIMSEAQNHI